MLMAGYGIGAGDKIGMETEEEGNGEVRGGSGRKGRPGAQGFVFGVKGVHDLNSRLPSSDFSST